MNKANAGLTLSHEQVQVLSALNRAISGMAVKVAAFMHVGGQDVSITPKFDCNIPEETKMLRGRLIAEEVEELLTAIKDNNFVEIVDGIADVMYVVIGTALAYGIPTGLAFDVAHESNMTKINPETGQMERDAGGKIVKPATFKAPDFLTPMQEWTAAAEGLGGDVLFKRDVIGAYLAAHFRRPNVAAGQGLAASETAASVVATN